MLSSKSWAILAVMFFAIAFVWLMIVGYYLGQSFDPIYRSFGRMLMAFGAALLCGMMHKIMVSYEMAQAIRKTVNTVLGRGKQ